MPVDAVLAWDDRHGREQGGRVVDVEVASHPIGVDVKFDRALDPSRNHAGGELADSEALTGGPDELPVGADAEGAARNCRLAANRRAPARRATAGHRAVEHAVIDEQVKVLAHRGNRKAARWNLRLPGPDLGRAVPVGDDRAEAGPQGHPDAPEQDEPSAAGGELETAVEPEDQMMDLTAGHRVAVVPTRRPRIDRPGVQSEANNALVHARDGHPWRTAIHTAGRPPIVVIICQRAVSAIGYRSTGRLS